MKKIFAALLACLLALAAFAAGAAAVGAEEGTQAMDCITYEDFGAAGDGVTDDLDAIVAAHEAANELNLSVRAKPGATYYIGPAGKTANIQTNTDWGTARFILDDREVADGDRGKNVFSVTSMLGPVSIDSIDRISKGQAALDLGLGADAFVVAVNDTVKQYIRNGYGLSNAGESMTDVLVVDRDGRVHPDTPVLWDFNTVTSLTAYPIESETLLISGGIFTTRANQAPLGSSYIKRGIGVRRSNVVIDGIYHDITDEETSGRPYDGFINIDDCAYVTIQNAVLSGHKIVNAGSYDSTAHRVAFLTYRNCSQANSIHDRGLWGIMGINWAKNAQFDHVAFSRFDAHAGVHNATIKDSLLGYQGINLIGSGTFLVENTKVYAGEFITFREDYGSTWEGDVIIRNCEFKPFNGELQVKPVLFIGANSGFHDFGYPCYMPRKIVIDGLLIDDTNHPFFYIGPRIFSSFSSPYVIDIIKEFFGIGVNYPIAVTEKVEIKDLTIMSGRPLVKSFNFLRFWKVQVTRE